MRNLLEGALKASYSKVQQSIFFEKYAQALMHYENSLKALDQVYSGEYVDESTGKTYETLQSGQQVVDLIKNLEIPVCLKLAKCYMMIEKPLAKKSLEYCTRVIDKNLGVVTSSDEPDDIVQMSYRSKAFFRRAQALKALAKHK